MEAIVKGLQTSGRRSSGLYIARVQLRRPIQSSSFHRNCQRGFESLPLPFHRHDIVKFVPSRQFSQQFFLKTQRSFHTSIRNQSEDPRAFKPQAYPEAEWARVNDEFEQKLMKRSWFFRPLFRLMGHPKFHAGNVTFQFFLIGGIISGWIYMWFFMGYSPKPIPKDGTGRELTDEEVQEMETIENYLHSHPVVMALRSQKYLIESRPHWAIPDKDVPHNLTGGTLRGLGRVSVAPIAFSDGEGKEFYAVLHVGKDLCGRPGIVHTGLLATVVDESLARCCFPALPNRIGVTANLNIDHINPLPADSYVLVKARTIRLEGRKAWVEGTVESLGTVHQEKEPTLYVEAKGLFIEPKYAAIMKVQSRNSNEN